MMGRKTRKEGINDQSVPTVIILLMTILFGFALFAGNVSATPIQGSITFFGQFSPTGGSGLGDATGLTISNPIVMNTTGDLNFSFGPATFKNLNFDGTPISNFWHTSNFSFDLNYISIVHQDDLLLALSGVGTMHGFGFEDSPGDWSFQNVYGTSQGFSGTSVPDASIMLLLGTSLFCLGVLSRKKYRME